MRTGRCVRDDVARSHVLGAAHDPGGVAPEVDVDECQLVGLRMLHDVEHPCRDHSTHVAAGLVDALDLQADLVERRDQLVGRGLGRRELPDPGQRRAHQCLSIERGSARRPRRRYGSRRCRSGSSQSARARSRTRTPATAPGRSRRPRTRSGRPSRSRRARSSP